MRYVVAFCIIITIATASHAHVYGFSIGNNDIELGQNYSFSDTFYPYIRIIEHPEMKDFYSYGFCAAIEDKKKLGDYDHLHDKCVVIPGKNWWYLPNYEKDGIPVSDNPYKPTYLVEVILEDDIDRAGYFFWTGMGFGWGLRATAIGVKGIWMVAKPAITKFITDTAISLGFMGIGAAFDDDEDRKTIRYTQYKTWAGKEDLLLDLGEVFRISLDECTKQCLSDSKNLIEKKFYDLIDRGAIEDYPKTPAGALDYEYDDICELHCEMEGHPEFATPNIYEMWMQMSSALVAADFHEYKRVLFDYAQARWPWSDPVPNLQITYMTPQEIRRFVVNKDARFKGSCPIGSECDRKYPMRTPNPMSLSYKGYHKSTLQNLQNNYSPAVINSLTQN